MATATTTPPLGYSNRWLIAGQSGTGKSWYARYLITQYIREQRKRSIIVLDNSMDHWPTLQGLGFEHVTIGQEHIRRGIPWSKFLSRHPRVLIEATYLDSDETMSLVDSLSRAVAESVPYSLLVIDEAWSFYNKNYPAPNLERLLRGGRKHNIDIMLITQRLQDLATPGRSQTNLLVMFHLDDLTDINLASERLAPVRGISPREVLPRLRQGQAIVRDVETGQQERINTYKL